MNERQTRWGIDHPLSRKQRLKKGLLLAKSYVIFFLLFFFVLATSAINRYIIFTQSIFFGDPLEVENIFRLRVGSNLGPFRQEANVLITGPNRALVLIFGYVTYISALLKSISDFFQFSIYYQPIYPNLQR